MPTEEQIRELAYSIWEREGRPDGKDVDHYMRAKQILEARETEKAAFKAPSAGRVPAAGTAQPARPRANRPRQG
jgi:hypothetical protein